MTRSIPKYRDNSTQKSRRSTARGFTLIELLVAVGVMLILLVIIGRLFGDVGKVTELFAANSQITDYAAAMGNSLRGDIRQINHDGFMVIKTRSIRSDQTGTYDAEFPANSPFTLAPLYPTYNNRTIAPSAEPQRTNTDMLMFFANGPWNTQRYDSKSGSSSAALSRSVQSGIARITYGHIASNNNSPPASTTFALSQLFQPEFDNNYPQSLIPVASNRWILGRHATLMVSSASPTSTTDFAYAPTSLWMAFNSAGDGLGLAGGLALNANQGFRNGLWDVAYSSNLLDIRSSILTTTSTSPVTPAQYPTNPVNTTAGTFHGWGSGSASIPGRMADCCYRVFGTRNLDLSSTSANNSRVALMRTSAALAPYCSNFQVEFAGSYVNPANTTVVDREDTANNGAAITPVLAAHFGMPIYWYGGIQMSTGSVTTTAGMRRIVPSGTATADTFLRQFERGSSSADTAVSPAGGNREYSPVFGYDRSVTPWPRFLRITATFHDDKGRFRQAYLKELNLDPIKTFAVSAPFDIQTLSNYHNSTLSDGRTYQWIIEVPQ